MIDQKWLVKTFLLLVGLFFFLALTGCGGGGSGSTAGASPSELEIQAVIDSFATSVKSQNVSSVMENFDTNLKYYPVNPAVVGGYEDYNQFRSRLANFFTGATVTDFKMNSIGIDAGMENVAMARGSLSCSYSVNGQAKELNEQVEMKLERVSRWGITEIYAYDSAVGQTGMLFPPQF